MGDILKFLANYPQALYTVGVLVLIGIILIFIIFTGGFLQGRAVTFWPPRVGEKRASGEKYEASANVSPKEGPAIRFPLPENTTDPNFRPNISYNDILITPKAYLDCDKLGIQTNKITDYILQEVRYHPLMFLRSFSSMQLIYLEYVLFASWDGSQVQIERVLKREKAFPVSDAWFAAVALYRQGTAQPYRVKQKELITLEDLKKSVKFYRKLVAKIKVLNELLENNNVSTLYDVTDLDSLIDEAEEAVYSDDQGTGIVRMEALLTTVHKFLLNNPPPTITINPLEEHSRWSDAHMRITKKGVPSIMIIDDDFFDRQEILSIIKEAGYDNYLAVGNSDDALRALVENDFDLIITDANLFGDKRGGREIVIAARQINPKTRVTVISNYPEIASVIGDIPNVPFILKHPSDKNIAFKEILKKIIKDKS